MSSFVCNLIMSCQSCLVHVCSYIIEPHVAAKAQAIKHMAESLRSVTHTCIVVDGINNFDSSIMQTTYTEFLTKRTRCQFGACTCASSSLVQSLHRFKNQFVFHWSWNRGRATPVYQHIISVPQQSTHHTEAHNNNKVGRVECLLIYIFIFSLFAIGIRPIITLTYTLPMLNSMSPQLQKLFLSTTAFIFRLQIMHTYLACQIPKSF